MQPVLMLYVYVYEVYDWHYIAHVERSKAQLDFMPYEQCSHGYILMLVQLEEWGCAPATQNLAMDSTQVV